MIEYTFRSIDKWPREFTKERRRSSPFGTYVQKPDRAYKTKEAVPFDRLMRELAIEVEKTGANRVVIELALKPKYIRRDGLPYSEARPEHPGVIVSFQTKHGPVKMPCDTFANWKDNVRAITLTLERLRLVDAYGVTQHGEQYRGWTALPPPKGSSSMTGTEAADFIAQHVPFIPASWILEKVDAFDTAYKLAAKKLHPDIAGGNGELFKTLQAAAEVLRRHHGVTE